MAERAERVRGIIVRWETPVPRGAGNGKAGGGVWEDVIAALQKRPGDWAIVAVEPIPKGATRVQIDRLQNLNGPALRKYARRRAIPLEVVTRQVETTIYTYARSPAVT